MKKIFFFLTLLVLYSCTEKEYYVDNIQFWKHVELGTAYNIRTTYVVEDSTILLRSIPVLEIEHCDLINYFDKDGLLYARLIRNYGATNYEYQKIDIEESKAAKAESRSRRNSSLDQILNDGTKCAIMSEDFVKATLTYPKESKFKTSSHSHEVEGGQAVVMNKFKKKNAFGVTSEHVYKIWMTFNGGEWNDINNWSYTKLIIENSSTGEQYQY